MSDNSQTNAHVLVIDDELPICQIITRILESRGFQASSVSEHSAILETVQKEEFDVILLDRSMTKRGSSNLVAELRVAAPKAKILFFTGELVDPVEEATVDGVIQKPVNGRKLAETLRAML